MENAQKEIFTFSFQLCLMNLKRQYFGKFEQWIINWLVMNKLQKQNRCAALQNSKKLLKGTLTKLLVQLDLKGQ
jgi:hypothetical protein